MNSQIFQLNAKVPSSFLNAISQNTEIAIGDAFQALFGTTSVAWGLGCTPASGLTVQLAPGGITSYQQLAPNGLGATSQGPALVSTNYVVKEASSLSPIVTAALTAPSTAGQSINYLIEAQWATEDTAPLALTYGAISSQGVYSESTGSQTDNTRSELVSVQVIAGAPASTGSQSAPGATAGWSPLWVVSVNAGETSIIQSNIVKHPNSPILGMTFPQVVAALANQGLYAPLASPVFTGNPQAPTPASSDSSTSIATTAWVKEQAYITGVNTSGFAPLASPGLTGTPTAPTASAGTNSNQLATTQFVETAVNGLAPLASPQFTGSPTVPTAAAGDNTGHIASTAWCQSNFLTSSSGASYAPINSPAFTGTPTGPTPAVGDNSAKLATTAFVSGNYLTAGQVQTTFAPINTPTFTGTPSAPNPSPGDSSTRLATTNFVTAGFAPNTNFASSLAINGYQKLPGGMIMQWGYAAGPYSEQSVAVSLPIAFPNACLNAQATVLNDAALNTISTWINIQALGVNQVTFYVNRDQSGDPNIDGFYWTAFGY